jgi:hypothetical protein
LSTPELPTHRALTAAPRDGEEARDAYARQASDSLDNLDDDYVIVGLLCHC